MTALRFHLLSRCSFLGELPHARRVENAELLVLVHGLGVDGTWVPSPRVNHTKSVAENVEIAMVLTTQGKYLKLLDLLHTQEPASRSMM